MIKKIYGREDDEEWKDKSEGKYVGNRGGKKQERRK